MKKPEDSLKKDLDKGINFVDYFLTVGLDYDLIFNDFLYENEISVLNESELTKPVLLSKFPPFEKTLVNIDDSLISVKLFLIM